VGRRGRQKHEETYSQNRSERSILRDWTGSYSSHGYLPSLSVGTNL
jgi:hypothetical protein